MSNTVLFDSIQKWEDAKKRLDSAESEIISSRCRLNNAIASLGKNLVPDKYEPGEIFNIWVNDKLLVVKTIPIDNKGMHMGDFKIYWRE